jgi:hypothetical protein
MPVTRRNKRTALAGAEEDTAGNPKESGSSWFVVTFHAVFAAACGLALYPCLAGENAPYPSGYAVSVLVVAYSAVMVAMTQSRYPDLYKIWEFAAILSVFQVLPDWFLNDALSSLEFPNDGVFRFGGAVSWYMAMMWTIPIFLVVWSCKGTGEPTGLDCIKAAVAALAIFGASEELTHPLNLWHATKTIKQRWGKVAIYVLPAELVLGPAALFAFRFTLERSFFQKAVAAFCVALMYTGALAISYLFIELGAAPF